MTVIARATVLKFRKNSVIDDLLPSYLELAHKFREKFGREMTQQERRLYELTKTWLESGDDAEGPGKEAKAAVKSPMKAK